MESEPAITSALTIIVSGTSGVRPDEMSSIRSGVRDVLDALRAPFPAEVREDGAFANRVCSLSGPNQRGQRTVQSDLFTDVVSHLMEAARRDGRVLVDWDVLAVIVIENDLTAPGCNFLFGATEVDPAKVVMLSIARFRQLEPVSLRLGVLRRLARHECGHAYGLVPEGRANAEDNIGWHCTNLCAMRQALSLDVVVRQTSEEADAGPTFCRECASYLARYGGGSASQGR